MARKRRTKGKPDYGVLLAVVALLIIGLMMVYSATFDWSYQEHGSSFRIAMRQCLWTVVGIVGLIVFSHLPYEWWRDAAVPIMAGTLALLVLVLVFGDERFGAQRSFWRGSIHPGELAKLTVVIYIAAWLSSKGDEIRDVSYGLIPFAVLIGVVTGLIVAQPDLGTAVLIALTSLAVFFFAGADVFQLAAGGVVSGLTFLFLVSKFPHASQRIDDWRQVWRDPELAGYHMQQTLIALGSGGLLGTGLGQGQQKLGYLPAQHTDAIFAVLGEETGLWGCLLVIGLFSYLAYRGFKITMNAQEPFAALLACGVTCSIIFQALINFGVVTGLLPFTGMALPFISSGGSGMVTSLAAVGLLLSVSRGRSRRRQSSREEGSHNYASLDRRWGNGGARVSRSRRRRSAAER